MAELLAEIERPTLIERVFRYLHPRYTLVSFVIAFLIFGSPFGILASYLETFDLGEAYASEIPSSSFLWVPPWLVLLSFYLFYIPFFIRKRILRAREALASLLPNREEDYQRLFGKISSLGPPLAIFAFLAVYVEGPSLFNGTITSPVSFLRGATFTFFFSLGLSSLLWSYYISLRGIHKMGSIVELRPYFEDPSLGLRPVGAFALVLSGVYFGFVGLLSPAASSPTLDFRVLALLSVLIMVGLALFFLPLRRLHQRMLTQKRVEKLRVSREMASILTDKSDAGSIPDLVRMFKLDMRKREVSSIATWPFDFQVLGKLTIIVLSVTAALTARVIQVILKI